jgi:hypothetical protein
LRAAVAGVTDEATDEAALPWWVRRRAGLDGVQRTDEGAADDADDDAEHGEAQQRPG